MPGNPLNITLPTVGETVGPTYASNINDAIQAIIDDVEANVVSSEITIDGDLSFTSSGTAYSANDLDTVNFTSRALLSSGDNELYAVSGELYWRDAAGNNVKMTNTGNVAGSAGSISTTGSPAYGDPYHVVWDGSNGDFQFKNGSGNTFADLIFGKLEFRSGAFTLTMQTSVSSDYTLTWPATIGSNNSLLAVNAAGTISYTDDPTLVGLNLTTGDLDLTSGDVNITNGVLLVGGSYGIQNNGRLDAGGSYVTSLTSTGNISTSGSANINAGGRAVVGGPWYHQLNPWTAVEIGATGNIYYDTDKVQITYVSGLYIPVPNPAPYWTDWDSIELYCGNSAVTANVTAELYKVYDFDGTVSIVNVGGGDVDVTTSCASGSVTNLSLAFGDTYQTEIGYSYYIKLTTAAASGNLEFYGGRLEYDVDSQGVF